jgi:hypothetical protein
MRSLRYGLVASLAVLLVAAACSKSGPASPSSSAVGAPVDATLTPSVAAPRPVAPANGAQIANLAQPVTLVAQNALVTQPGGATYAFEVATDAAFGSKAQTKDGISEGSGGQTSIKLDALPAGKEYYWHVRATAGGTIGVFGAAFTFTIGPAIAVSAPVPVTPANGAKVADRPTLTVTNAARVGPVGAISYRFEISATSTFSLLTVTGTVAEGSGQTSFTPSVSLAGTTTYYWRVTAIDQASGTSSPASATQTFTTTVTIDLHSVIISYVGAPNPADWPVTATIGAVEQDGSSATPGNMCISFATTVEWPNIPFFGDPDVPVWANQWYFANIGGKWYGGPGEYLRADRGFCKSGQHTNEIGPDGGWISPMREWAPKPGELVGFMMSTPARSGMRSTDQRSNIVIQPWFDSSVALAGARANRK